MSSKPIESKVFVTPAAASPVIVIHPKPSLRSTDLDVNRLEKLRAACELISPFRR